jgi:transcriptional regulator with XRE-family HTH domain
VGEQAQGAVARGAHIGKSQLSKYETGKELPKFESLERVLTALGVGQLDFFSTLEMVTRKSADLEGLDTAFLPPDLGHGLLSEDMAKAFNELVGHILRLYRVVLVEKTNNLT